MGVPDESRVRRIKAFVVLKDHNKAGSDMELELINDCRGRLIK
ncbi:MAG TPA: hypothetical protein ENO00_10515 [Deltaproteobacteria bacterium]|nr:hypothetical protein [Deltaproteobacteria bacterium]